MSFFEVSEDENAYKDVCVRGNTGTNVKDAFKSLQCTGEKLYDWEVNAKEYIRRFTRGKRCMQRRLTNMKKYSANTNELEKSRKKHAYPILVAYAYAKDCARKLGTRKNVRTFTESADNLVEKLAGIHANIATSFKGGIDSSASAHPELNALLQKPYYTPEQWDIIDRFRENQANSDAELAYNSIIDAELPHNAYNATDSFNNVIHNESVENEEVSFVPARTRRIRKKTIRKKTTVPLRVPTSNPTNNFNVSNLPTRTNMTHIYKDKYKAILENWKHYILTKLYEDIYLMCKNNIENDNDILKNDLPKLIFDKIYTRVSNQIHKNNELLVEVDKSLRKITNDKYNAFSFLKQSIAIHDMMRTSLFFKYIFDDLIYIIDGRVDYLRNNMPDIFNSLSEFLFAISDYNKNIKESYDDLMKHASETSNMLQKRDESIDKLKFTIKEKGYKRTNTIGRMFYEKLDALEKVTISNDVQQKIVDILAYRTDLANSLVNTMETIKSMPPNPLLIQVILPRIAEAVPRMDMKNPRSYTIHTTGISDLSINIIKRNTQNNDSN